jgi:hypothetical protein
MGCMQFQVGYLCHYLHIFVLGLLKPVKSDQIPCYIINMMQMVVLSPTWSAMLEFQ